MHEPVLLNETIAYLAPKTGEIVVDGTVGGGGHAKEFCKCIGSEGTFVGIDKDSQALERTKEALGNTQTRVILAEENFRNVDSVLAKHKIPAPDVILFDIGLSSTQLEASGRGFSFQKDEPLKMTFKAHPTKEDITAEDVVNDWEETHLIDIFRGFGGERFAGKIARGITEARKKKRITTTGELVEIIKQSVPAPYRTRKIHCATKTFQAIRMAVNDEVGALHEGLRNGFGALKSGGRMAVISFHSLEDKIVKDFFRKAGKEGRATILTKKPVVPSREEVLRNRRARSAKLRAIQKV